jgi:hypothetical protein
MMEFLKFTFDSGEHFVGVGFLALIAAWGISGWFQIHHHHHDEEDC